MYSTDAVPLDFTLKVVSRCNLDCSYCYVYHKADTTWRQRPKFMPDAIFSAALERIVQHCRESGQDMARLTFHGGEPLLAGVKRFSWWCDEIRSRLAFVGRVELSVQTNGTKITRPWIRLFQDHRLDVGVSVDGAPETHDVFRVNRRGMGSSAAVAGGLEQLSSAGVPLAYSA